MAKREFYVGYLPLPRGVKQFLLIDVSAIIVGVVAAAIVGAASQDDPGGAVWSQLTDGETIEVSGGYQFNPYPMIFYEEDGESRVMLLVSQGKIGGPLHVEMNDQTMLTVPLPVATATGYTLTRSGLTILELVDADALNISEESLRVDEYFRDFPISTLESVSLQGEIIDPKCYLGAMKPGESLTHRACAILCLRGGIPPMFVTRHADGGETFYLLTDAEGNGFRDESLEALFPYVGLQVRIEARAQRWGDLNVLQLDPADIHPIP